MDMIVQGIAAVIGAVVGVWLKVNPFVGIYCALVVIDTALGIRQSTKRGVAFSWSWLLWGPGEKVVFAALILMAGQYIETFVGQWLTRSMAAYVSTVLFLEAVGKYDYITGHNVLAFIRDRIKAVITTTPKPTKKR